MVLTKWGSSQFLVLVIPRGSLFIKVLYIISQTKVPILFYQFQLALAENH